MRTLQIETDLYQPAKLSINWNGILHKHVLTLEYDNKTVRELYHLALNLEKYITDSHCVLRVKTEDGVKILSLISSLSSTEIRLKAKHSNALEMANCGESGVPVFIMLRKIWGKNSIPFTDNVAESIFALKKPVKLVNGNFQLPLLTTPVNTHAFVKR